MSFIRRKLLMNRQINDDEFIINASPYLHELSDGTTESWLEIKVEIPDENAICYAYCENEKIKVKYSTGSIPHFDIISFTTDSNTNARDIIIRGNYKQIIAFGHTENTQPFPSLYIHEIKKWGKTDTLWDDMFYKQKLTQDFILPEQIKYVGSAFKNAYINNKNFIFSNNILSMSSQGYHSNSNDFFGNATLENDIYIINKIAIALAVSYATSLTSVTIPNGVEYISSSLFYNNTNLTSVIFNSDGVLKRIGSSAFSQCSALTELNIPSSVNKIESNAFSYNNGSMKISSVTFNQPFGMEVELPEAGSGTGMFYVKTARSMTIYTDNETIKNYNWSTDNITATLYHLDGSSWG